MKVLAHHAGIFHLNHRFEKLLQFYWASVYDDGRRALGRGGVLVAAVILLLYGCAKAQVTLLPVTVAGEATQ